MIALTFTQIRTHTHTIEKSSHFNKSNTYIIPSKRVKLFANFIDTFLYANNIFLCKYYIFYYHTIHIHNHLNCKSNLHDLFRVKFSNADLLIEAELVLPSPYLTSVENKQKKATKPKHT